MRTVRTLAASIAAVAMLLALAGSALADGSVQWTGNGSDAAPCTGDHAGQTHWIFTTGGKDTVTAAQLTIDGSDGGAMAENGQGSWSLYVDGGLPQSASVAFAGDLGDGRAVLTISCLGVTTTTSTSTTTTEQTTGTTATSTTETTTATSTSTTETTSTTGSMTSSTTTGSRQPSLPPTDAVATGGGSGNSTGTLVLALLALVACVAVLVRRPFRSR